MDVFWSLLPLPRSQALLGNEFRESLVRGLRFGSIPSTTYRNILEASAERRMYSYVAGSGATVSVIVPNLIFEELEIQKIQDVVQKPPIVPSPLKD